MRARSIGSGPLWESRDFLLLWSAQSPADYELRAAALDSLTPLPLDERVERAAARVQAALARRSRHRGPKPTDLLIAATAEVNSAVLLHHDRHFDEIRRVTGQPMEWLPRRGALD